MVLTIGIDASRNRSGGAQAHLSGLLTGAYPTSYGIRKVHLWAYPALIDAVLNAPWLVKHSPPVLEKSVFHQIWWQYHFLPQEARECGCDVIFNTDAGSICPFKASVTMSQDMLSYEPGEMQRFGLSKARLRLWLLRYIQARSLKKGNSAIFLTNYAARVIQKITGTIKHYTVIPHGVGDEFRQAVRASEWPNDSKRRIRLLYVSNASMYKHQWHVVDAVGKIRRKGFNISLLLVGGGKGRAQRLLSKAMSATDPKGEFIEQMPYVEHSKIPEYLANADIFIFASSCENMPITLLEAMASGLPIACSDRGPMPEVLEDAGVYFDPENPDTIAEAVETIITDRKLRIAIANRAKQLSDQYSWSRCADETWRFLSECVGNTRSQTKKRERVALKV